MPSPSVNYLQELPNIAVSGTPGTGKSTLCSALVKALPGLRYINVSSEVEGRGCRAKFDQRLQTWEVDERKLVQSLHKDLEQGGALLDWIHADYLVPDDAGGDDGDGNKSTGGDMIDLVIQMRADTATLFDRYKIRGYTDEKIQENLDCEIMDEIGSENRDVFDKNKCVVLQGVAHDGEENVSRVLQWFKAWQANNSPMKKAHTS